MTSKSCYDLEGQSGSLIFLYSDHVHQVASPAKQALFYWMFTLAHEMKVRTNSAVTKCIICFSCENKEREEEREETKD